MWCSKILAAYDDSEPAQRALAKAIDIAAADPQIEIQIVHVIKWLNPIDAGMGNLMMAADGINRQADEILKKMETVTAGLNNPGSAVLLRGVSPAEILLDHARRNGCDLIVIGAHGRSGMKRFLGSVSHGVVNQSDIPVLVIK